MFVLSVLNKILGQVFSDEVLKSEQANAAAINNLISTDDLAGVRRFCGLVNFLSWYTTMLFATLQQMNDLMKSDAQFACDY